MHSDDDDKQNVSETYGLWPGIIGIVLAGGLIWFMFALADGFA